ncbi:penicillin-binding protein 2 [Leucobacter weissii]|uniref:Penicillin-binding protein 2 n=1 Tax=Leucobacter weissii TaxID=1983706 RepID=A0A939MNE1_9MICO|nr:penicillin-binding protein 2 [Leucobacter weissii]MBO1902012.1 penicillin-binding protein 2 [Leucobacter weissii]
MTRTRSGTARRLIALTIVVVGALVFAVRLFDVQVVSAEELGEQAKGKRAVPIVIPSLRGDIVDRNGEILGTTDERYDVQLSPKNTRVGGGSFYRPADEGGIATVRVTSQQAFAEIGEITGQTAEEIETIVDDALEEDPKSDFAYVKRSVDLTTLTRLKALNIPWLTFDSNHARSYPNGAVAGNLIGFAGADSEPQAGVELSQDACLTGIDGEESYERGADGVALPGSVVVTQEAVNGGTVQLTVDRDLQWETQQIIDAQVKRVGAEWGLLTVVDIRTGELVAVAEDGSVDPNDVDAGDPTKREARSFVDPYEPGSTFKTITAAALIDSGAATPGTTASVPSTWRPEDGVVFSDSFQHEAMPWTLAGIMLHSSNVGISMLGSKLDAETRYDYLRAFGIGESTRAGLQVEDAGLLYPPDQWDRQTSYNTMFGQGLSSTIVQTAGVYQTIANGGVRVPPSVVASCTGADGSVQEPEHGEAVRVVSEKTADSMMQMLENVVKQGWISEHVSIPGYRIAGKTGTAEQADGRGGYRGDFVHSFAGIFPADDPQYVVVSSIAYPTSGDGGVAALRSFHDAAEATIRTFHIPPSTGKYRKLPTGDEQ